MKKSTRILSHYLLLAASILLVLPHLAGPSRTNSVALLAPDTAAAVLVVRNAADSISTFQERLKAYMTLQEETAKKLPKPSSKSRPDKIEIYQEGLAEEIKTARSSAKPGDIFAQDIAAHIRGLMKGEFKGQRLKELRKNVLKADTKGVALRINHPYPETKEVIEMPPALLLKLPELPKQLRYRFVGRYLVLMDREAGIIVDYLPNALP